MQEFLALHTDCGGSFDKRPLVKSRIDKVRRKADGNVAVSVVVLEVVVNTFTAELKELIH